MSNQVNRCPKCAGNMAQGFVPDYSQSAAIVAAWQPGHPQKSFWRRTKAPPGQGIPLGAFRCEKCGLVELYADSRFAAQ